MSCWVQVQEPVKGLRFSIEVTRVTQRCGKVQKLKGDRMQPAYLVMGESSRPGHGRFGIEGHLEYC